MPSRTRTPSRNNSSFGSGGRSSASTTAAQRTTQSNKPRGGFGSLQNAPTSTIGGGNRASGSGFSGNTLNQKGGTQVRTTGGAKDYQRQEAERRAQEAARRSVSSPSNNTRTTTNRTVIVRERVVYRTPILTQRSISNSSPYYNVYQQPSFGSSFTNAIAQGAGFQVGANLANDLMGRGIRSNPPQIAVINGLQQEYRGQNITAAQLPNGQGIAISTPDGKNFVVSPDGQIAELGNTNQKQDDNRFDWAWKPVGAAATFFGAANAWYRPGLGGKLGGLALLAAGVATLVK
jgi:hypothetical protein